MDGYSDQGIIRNFAPWFRLVDIEPVLDVFDAFGQTLGIRLTKMEVRLMEPFDVLMYQFLEQIQGLYSVCYGKIAV
mgnify:FL=1